MTVISPLCPVGISPRGGERRGEREDGYTFIIENEHRGELPNNISHLTHEHVLIAKKYIDDMVDMVIELLNVKTKREFKKVLFEEEIEVEDIGGVLIPI